MGGVWNEHNPYISGYILVFLNDTEKEKEGLKEAKKERQRASVREIKGDWHGSELPHNNAHEKPLEEEKNNANTPVHWAGS